MNGVLALIGRTLSRKIRKLLLSVPIEEILCLCPLHLDMKEEYGEMKKMMGKASIHMFPHGGHPSILSNAEEFAVIARDFIMENVRLN